MLVTAIGEPAVAAAFRTAAPHPPGTTSAATAAALVAQPTRPLDVTGSTPRRSPRFAVVLWCRESRAHRMFFQVQNPQYFRPAGLRGAACLARPAGFSPSSLNLVTSQTVPSLPLRRTCRYPNDSARRRRSLSTLNGVSAPRCIAHAFARGYHRSTQTAHKAQHDGARLGHFLSSNLRTNFERRCVFHDAVRPECAV